MPPFTPRSTLLRGWTCPQCTRRTLSTTTRRQAVGPEHPRYIEVSEPPQQTSPNKPFQKGRLPVPRDVFAGAQGKDRAADSEIAKATPYPKKQIQHPAGSREAWKQRLAEARRRNLREGLQDLRARRISEERKRSVRTAKNRAEREELASAPEREDERLTTPSTGLDLDKLLHGPLEDPHREARLAHKARNVELHASAKQAERLDHLHTLYTRARSFIVTPQQLDNAVEEAFSGDRWSGAGTITGAPQASVWSYGRPESVQDMLNRANRVGGKTAMEGTGGFSDVSAERMRRIAEKLTGGKMEEGRGERGRM